MKSMSTDTLTLIGLLVLTTVIAALCLLATQQCSKRAEPMCGGKHVEHMTELYTKQKPPYRRIENMAMLQPAIDGLKTAAADKLDELSESIRP